MAETGHARPGRAISISNHVRYATKRDDRLSNCDPSLWARKRLMHRNVIRAKREAALPGGLSEETIGCLAQAAVRLAFSTARRPAIASSTATLACSIDAMA